MSDPRDIDEDAILKGLSAAELDQLECELQEMDPEVRGSAAGPPTGALGVRFDVPRVLVPVFL